MDNKTAQTLINLNHQFYQSFAASFSSTRFSVQPGVKKITSQYLIEPNKSASLDILDIGCGNGEMARYLGKHGFTGSYTGLDSSSGLLGFSGNSTEVTQLSPVFLNRDIAANDWDADFRPASFDRIVSFAVMHHIPGCELRTSILFLHSQAAQTRWAFYSIQLAVYEQYKAGESHRSLGADRFKYLNGG